MINYKSKTCCFTGHRKIPPENFEEISRRLETVIIRLIENGCIYFGAGGALGFDTLAAQAVLKLKTVFYILTHNLKRCCPQRSSPHFLFSQSFCQCNQIIKLFAV